MSWERVATANGFVIERRALLIPKPASGGGVMVIQLRRWRVRSTGTPGGVIATFRSRDEADEFVAKSTGA